MSTRSSAVTQLGKGRDWPQAQAMLSPEPTELPPPNHIPAHVAGVILSNRPHQKHINQYILLPQAGHLHPGPRH